jgi:hypothetical protein
MDRVNHLWVDIARLVPLDKWRAPTRILAWLHASSATACAVSKLPKQDVRCFHTLGARRLHARHKNDQHQPALDARFGLDTTSMLMFVLQQRAFGVVPNFLRLLQFFKDWELVLTEAEAEAAQEWAIRCILAGDALEVMQLFQTWEGFPLDMRFDNNRILRWAAEENHVPVLQFLHKAGLTMDDVRAADNYALRMAGQSPRTQGAKAPAQNEHLSVLRLLRDWQPDGGWTYQEVLQASGYALKWAAINGDVEVLRFFREWRFHDAGSPDRLPPGGLMKGHALAHAAVHGHDDAMSFLMEWMDEGGEDVPQTRLACVRAGNNNLLRVSAKNGHVRILHRLKEMGLTLDDALQAWQTELQFTCNNWVHEEAMLARLQSVWGPGVGPKRRRHT